MPHTFVHDGARWAYDGAFVPTATSAAALVAALVDGGPLTAERYAVPPCRPPHLTTPACRATRPTGWSRAPTSCCSGALSDVAREVARAERAGAREGVLPGFRALLLERI